MRARLTRVVPVLAVVVFVSSACHIFQSAPTKPAGVADIATRIENSAGEIFHEAVKAEATGTLSSVIVDKIAIQVNYIGRAGVELAIGLRDYSAVKAAGKDVTAQSANVQRILADITNALAEIGKAVPNGTIQAIDRAVASVLSIVTLVKGSL